MQTYFEIVKPGLELVIAIELELEHILHSVEIVKPGVQLALALLETTVHSIFYIQLRA